MIAAGQARIVGLPHRISRSLTLLPSPGHTWGHAMLRLDSQGQVALFTGDAFHHPVQFTDPTLHLPGCDSPDEARRTRVTLIRQALAEQATLFPAHFGAPHCGTLTLSDGTVLFQPPGGQGPSQ